MGKRGEEDAHVKMEKKLKKSKNKTNDLLDAGDDNRHVEVDGGVSKKKGHKNRDKKRKSESNEDGDEVLRDKDKKKDKKRKSESNEDGDEVLRDKDQKKDKKRKSESNEDGDEDLRNKDIKKKDKKRKRDSSEDNHPSEKTQIEENVEKDCDPKPRKEKKSKHKHQSHKSELENDGKEADFQEDEFKKVDKKKKKKKKKKTDDHSDAEKEGKKKTKSVEKNSEKTTKSVENNTEKPKTKGKPKKVSFSGQVEVFPYSDTEIEKQKTKGDGLIRGKRFTPEEDEIVKEAVLNYIEVHNLGDDGLKMVLNCKSHAGMKKCWQEIATCIPYRPSSAVYYRAHILFERAETRSWTPEEIQHLRELHEKDGNKWKKMAEELGKHRFHVKDTWRRIKLKDRKTGIWNQEEYQSLYDLVNLDLQMKLSSEVKQSKHGMLRDNIPWCAISEKLSTRSDSSCCEKWYNQLTSSLVAEKKWSDADDYRLIGALYELDAACVEDVDWDNVLEHRPGDVCRKRWNQMVCHIGHHGSKPFSEQVDTLAKRYCPDLAETREAWDNKPVV